MRSLWVLALVTACVRSSTVVCGDRVCPADFVCAPLDGDTICATPEQLSQCAGAAPDEMRACTIPNTEAAACYQGVCLPAFCGNGRIEPLYGEVCDDANAVAGDRCSAVCRSDETCGNGITDPVTSDGSPEQCDDHNRYAYDGCGGACLPETARWEPVVFGGPSSRNGAAAAIDDRSGRIVVFGGIDALSNQSTAETWIWDGTSWRRPAVVSAPIDRASHGMAFDASRGRVVMFGGTRVRSGPGSYQLGDTWEWDGVRWQLRASTGPQARVLPAMTYDPIRERVLLFGGSLQLGNTPFSDTWEWDGTSWEKRTTATNPPGLRDPELAFDFARGVAVLVGNFGAGTQVWEYDGVDWVRRSDGSGPSPSPPERQGGALVWDPTTPAAPRVLFVGGVDIDDGRLSKTFSWDGTAWQGPAGVEYASASAVHDPLRGRVIVIGADGQRLAVDAWDGATWAAVEPPVQPVRHANAAAFDARRGVVVMHGGEVAPADTLELGVTGWRAITGTVPPRSRHAMAYDVANDRTVLFGGFRGVELMAETWLWDGATWTQATPVTSPPARSSAKMAYDIARRRVLLFGGIHDAAPDDTWLWDGAATSWTKHVGAGPTARYGPAMAYDALRERIVLFGGSAAADGTLLADTWTWDGTTWTKQAPATAPAGRQYGGMTWHPARKRIVLFGGFGPAQATLDDAWEWTGTDWVEIAVPNVPPSRGEHHLVPAPDGSGVLAIGGQGPGYLSDVWLLTWKGETRTDLCRDHSDGDGDGAVGCDDADCWASCTPLCWPGLPACLGDARCGDGTCDASRETRASCPVDCTGPPICGDFVCEPAETCPGDC